MTFAKRVKFAKTYSIVYGQSLLEHAVAQISLAVYGAHKIYVKANNRNGSVSAADDVQRVTTGDEVI